MKKIYVLLLFAITLINILDAQDLEPGFYPPDGSIINEDGSEVILPPAYLDEMYSETISFYASDFITLDIAGEPIDLPFVSATITGVSAPSGMNYDCNSEGCIFLPNSPGEVTLYGTPDVLGNYNLSLTAEVTVNTTPLGLPTDIIFNIPYDGTNPLLNLALNGDYSPINSFVPEFLLNVYQESVVDVIVNSPDHTTLETAVLAAGLAETLSGNGPFTVFAPTDAAFELIPADVMSSLLMDPMGSLTYVLTHHVHSGNVLSTDLSDGMMVPTLAGTNLTVAISDLGVFIDGANVSVADIQSDNGVVHVIDAVMVPSDLDIADSFLSIDNSEYLYSIDVLGKRVGEDATGIIIFDLYSSGRVIKRFKF
jgi:uncharacterized surface protein with fasciclin (FAS1) repeats